MIIKIIDKKIASSFSSDTVSENEFLANNPDCFATDFVFKEELFLYEYTEEKGFYLVDDWETLKKEKEEQRNQTQATNNSKKVEVLSQAQARLYMLQAGLLDQVEELLKDNLEAKIIWEYADEIKRDNKLISYVGEALSLTDEQLDEMFLEASKIEV